MQLRQYFRAHVRPFLRTSVQFVKRPLDLLEMRLADKNMLSQECVKSVKIKFGEKVTTMTFEGHQYPRYQTVFVDFDYDYIALIEQLGDKWVDYTWKNDSCPKCSYVITNDDWYDIWFDYKHIELSELEEQRREGTIKQFCLTDQWGDVVIESDNWEEIKQFVLSGKVDEHYNNVQEKRATDTDG